MVGHGCSKDRIPRLLSIQVILSRQNGRTHPQGASIVCGACGLVPRPHSGLGRRLWCKLLDQRCPDSISTRHTHSRPGTC